MKSASHVGVHLAKKLLRNRVVKTPVLESRILNELLGGGRLFIKAENLQHTGSFKYRGALHRLLILQQDDPEAAARGVVAFSSGNFGQALAAAATTLNIKCTIISPHDAPPVKLERIKKYGAKLITSIANYNIGENREIIAATLAKDISVKNGFTLLHPFDDIDVIHGQGTIGLEFIEQVEDILSNENNGHGNNNGNGNGNDKESDSKLKMETIICPAGGGGMAAGICLASQSIKHKDFLKVMTIEPTGYDDHEKSFYNKNKERLTLHDIYSPITNVTGEATSTNTNTNTNIDHPEKSIYCDALMAGAPGLITWDINSKYLNNAFSIKNDERVANAMKVAFDHYRLVLEPSGALALAAVIDGLHINSYKDEDKNMKKDGPVLPPGQVVGVVASGGNVDLNVFAKMMGCPKE